MVRSTVNKFNKQATNRIQFRCFPFRMGKGYHMKRSYFFHPPDILSLFFQVVELLTGGAQMPVTNENKILYLNLLAQYRLANQVREEVEHFLKGNAENDL